MVDRRPADQDDPTGSSAPTQPSASTPALENRPWPHAPDPTPVHRPPSVGDSEVGGLPRGGTHAPDAATLRDDELGTKRGTSDRLQPDEERKVATRTDDERDESRDQGKREDRNGDREKGQDDRESGSKDDKHEADDKDDSEDKDNDKDKDGSKDKDKNKEGKDGKDKDGDDKDGKDKDGKGGNRKPGKLPLIILGVVVILLIIGALIWWLLTRNQVSTDDAYTDGNAVTIAAKVSGYVTALRVDDNRHVHRGDVLLLIDQRDYIAARDQAAAQLGLAQAQLDSARVNLEIARVQFPAQRAQAQAQRESAEANRVQAQQAFERQHSVDARATTQQNIDTSNAQLRTAQANVRSAQAQLAVADLVPQNVKQAEAAVKEREQQVRQALAQLEQAELNLSYTAVTAPSDGWVTRRNVQQGMLVQTGQSLLSLVMPGIWVTANFKENQLERMRVGDAVDITVDAYPALDLHGHVDSVQLGSGSHFSAFPAENATGNFVKIVQRVPVKIVIDRGLDASQTLPLGLSVNPTVALK